MLSKKKGGYLLLFMILIGCYSFNVMGQGHSIIKVGLESVYQNVAQISLRSDGALAIGHYDENGFTQLGTLSDCDVTIEKATGRYTDMGSLYATYEEANKAAQLLSGIPVYIEESLFAVYTEDEAGQVIPSSTRYLVRDSKGKAIFIFNKGSKEIVLRGYDVGTGMYLTTVGPKNKYRGAIGIGGTTGLTPYNIVGIEHYLYGVVSGEMSPSWPEEALKAQSVAARSIANYQYNRYVSRGYNVVDTTATQVYGGYLKEDPRTNAAVDATKGEVIRYNGKVAEALYFSTSGGATESAVNVWGNNIPYLVGVSDSFETEPAQSAWSRTITLEEVDRCLKAQGIKIGKAQGVQIVSRTSSGRVQEFRVLGTAGDYSLTLEQIRTFFSSTSDGSLKSRLFEFGNGITGDAGHLSGTTIQLLSAYGEAECRTDELVMTDGKLTTPVSGEIVVQSATGVTTLGGGTQDGTVPSGETVWGDFTLYGQGFGHGVGMSQSGAKGMAKAGYDYISILKHYYTGITIG